MEGEPSLYGKLLRLDSVTAEGIMTDGCAVAVDALRTLSHHQCARDLVEEFDDEKYQARGLKGLGMDVKQAWSKVMRKSNTPAAGVKVMYKKVVKAMEDLIGALGTAENKVIKIALADRHRVNRCFDLLGFVYLDWSSVELKDVEAEFLLSHESVDHLTEDIEVAGVRAIMLAQATRWRHGHVETELKEPIASLEKEKDDLKARNKELSGQVGSLEASIARNKALVDDMEACLSRNIDLNVELKRKDEDLRKAEDSRKKPWDAPTSTGRTSEVGTSSTSMRVVASTVDEAPPARSLLRFVKKVLKRAPGPRKHELKEQLASKAMDVDTTRQDDEKYQARGLKGLGMDVKQAWSKVMRKSNTPAAGVKVMYKKVVKAMEDLIGALGTAENKVIKIALADRHRVNRCFDLLGFVYLDWSSVELKDVEAEFLLSHESVDHLTEDIEVAGVRAIMLAQATRWRHGHVETELKEPIASLEKEKDDLKARNKELSGQVGSLEASIARNKALVDDMEACLSRNIDLNVELKRKDEDLRKAEDSRKKVEELEENAKKLEGSRAALLGSLGRSDLYWQN
ncbi:autophagy-related protein 23-like [Miscanthus floridulus]|uniref:autophagy-related protein 23-like n=1 Tax=Miscanthus floridulus TaxID=154761 RepID=UPI00345AEA32